MALATGLYFWWSKPVARYPRRRLPKAVPRERQESDNYPALMNLNRGYFHQDWDIISGDPDEVVAAFREENPPQHVQNVISDIKRFLDVYGQGDDAALTSAFERVFTPEVDFYNMKGRTTREGLKKVIEILSNLPKT